jgi:hypothetical protein
MLVPNAGLFNDNAPFIKILAGKALAVLIHNKLWVTKEVLQLL